VQAIPPEIRDIFSDTELDEIAAHPVVLGEDHPATAIELAQDWAGRVQKIDADRALPWSDRSVWTEHDLAGALFLRGFLQKAMDQLSLATREKMQNYVDQADSQFRAYTVDDPAGRMGRIAHVDLAGRPWWWRRVPVSGPITEDLARW
jgi:hypothetical protein